MASQNYFLISVYKGCRTNNRIHVECHKGLHVLSIMCQAQLKMTVFIDQQLDGEDNINTNCKFLGHGLLVFINVEFLEFVSNVLPISKRQKINK